MNLRVRSRRAEDHATIWFWDWFGSFLLAIVAALIAVVLREKLAWWWLVLGFSAVCLVTHRIRISRANPATGQVTTFWFVIPVRRRRFALSELRSTRSDDWGADADDPHDTLEAGPWSLVCYRAAPIARWLHDARAELATPRAKARHDG